MEEKETINDEIDRKAFERDLSDNAAAQAEIARELAKPWCSDFPQQCIPEDNYHQWDLQEQRDIVEHDLTCLTTHVALDGTPLDPHVDRENEV